MKILVTGANGQVGQSIRKLAGQHPNLDFTFTDYEQLDITDQKRLEALFDVSNFNYCVNCAAYTAVDRAEKEADKAFRINAEGTKKLALICAAYQTILIHISTDFVFDGKKNTPYMEEDEPKPVNIYGKSKLQGDVNIIANLKEHFIIRTSWVYSEYGGNFVKTMIRLGKEKEELKVVSDQIGSPTYAGDLAAFILTLISTGTRSFGIINYSNTGAISWYDFAKAIMEEAGITIPVTAIPSKDYITEATRPQYSVLDLKKAAKTYNAKMLPWRDSLKKCIKILQR